MPIRPENAARYPADWKLRSYFVRFVRAKGRCEWCGVAHGAVGYWLPNTDTDPDSSFSFIYMSARALADTELRIGDIMPASQHGSLRLPAVKIIRIILTTAHVYDDRPEAASLLNLAALCQRCHNRHDMKKRRAGTWQRRRDALPTRDMFSGAP